MLNLKPSVVEDFWKKTDPRLSRILKVMESVEHWVVDDVPSVSDALARTGKKMDGASKETLARLSEDVICVMAYISSGKFLRTINWMDESHPGLSVHYIMESRQLGDLAPGRLMVDRLQTIKGLQLMGKVFAPSRTRLIAQLLKDEQKR